MTLSGHLWSGMYAAQASATAESVLGARTSISAMCESPSGGSRMVAGPRTTTFQFAGATKDAPPTVCLGVSVVSCSRAEPAWTTLEGRTDACPLTHCHAP